MQIIAREVRNYITPEGRNPFRQWLTELRDKRTRANIQRRIARLQEGNFGDCKRLGSDLYELRINYGPGYTDLFWHAYFSYCYFALWWAKRNATTGY